LSTADLLPSFTTAASIRLFIICARAIMARHSGRGLTEPACNLAVIRSLFGEFSHNGVPKPMDRETWRDLPLTLKLAPQLHEAATQPIFGPRLAVTVGAKSRHGMLGCSTDL
jgi:hypothetical protein